MSKAGFDGCLGPRIERGRLRPSLQRDGLGGRGDGLDGQVPDLLGGGSVDQGEQPGQRLVQARRPGRWSTAGTGRAACRR